MNEFMDPTKALITLAVIIAIAVLLFLAFRAIVLWYYKIDTRVANQKQIIHLLTELLKATHASREKVH